jgi:hypothetical protein
VFTISTISRSVFGQFFLKIVFAYKTLMEQGKKQKDILLKILHEEADLAKLQAN